MKRCLTFLLAACILCGVLVGCSSAPDTSQQSSSSSDISSNVTDDSESTDSSATELPDGPVKDAINTASQTLLNGTASGKLMEEGESIAVWVETQSSGYANKEELSSNFVEFIEEFCSNCETDFPYTGVGFSLFVDDDIVAMVTPLFKEGKFILQSDPLIVNDEYSQIKSLVSNSAYFSGGGKLQDIISDKYFTAAPEDYPAEQYGEQIVDGDFGTALKDLNADFKESGEGQEIIALYKEGDTSIQVHYSPSDKAVEEDDYETIAIEFISMAKLIISNINQYSDIPTKSVTVVLGRSSAILIATDPSEYGASITSFSALSENEELNDILQTTYDIAFEDMDVSNILS